MGKACATSDEENLSLILLQHICMQFILYTFLYINFIVNSNAVHMCGKLSNKQFVFIALMRIINYFYINKYVYVMNFISYI